MIYGVKKCYSCKNDMCQELCMEVVNRESANSYVAGVTAATSEYSGY